jgi:transcription-repair coupling factor (superfamily II helicase)
VSPIGLAELLVDAGFTREDPADEHGEFAARGGILDVFPAGESQPVRLEFVGDTIESLRRYEPATQRSVETLDQISIVPLRDVLSGERGSSIFEYLALAKRHRVIVSERDEVEIHALRTLEQIQHSFEETVSRREAAPEPAALMLDWGAVDARLSRGTELVHLAIDEGSQAPPAQPGSGATHVRCQPTVERKGRVGDWVAEIRALRDAGETIVFVAATPGRAERTIELLKEYDTFAVPIERADDARYAVVLVAVGTLSKGFRLPDAGLQIYAEPDVFEEERRAPERRTSAAKAFLSDLRDLKIGDLVVHVDHGIGAFVGLRQIGVGDTLQEFLELRYAGDDKLFVPVERLDLVQKYTGAVRPPLDRLGGTSWERAKTKVKKAMRDMAEELLKLYAARKAVAGYGFSPDSHWQQEFEDAFEYDLTPDQVTAITDIKRDMEAPTPMDRLLCGDVGYGKTEVAMRAAFKAVMDGKQVAVLAPTTVLAFQHQKTFRERFAGFPVRVEMVSRFRSKAEQKEALADLAAGKVDIIIGTHRLLSKDVQFRDLGFLVVDEEQRFGVAHKEKIKQLRKKVDVLTMSATPIPRTLNMSLVGIRDMSIIETPPKDRLSIQTNVVKFDQQVIRRAIQNELARGGQVYFVHNRVESIFSIGNLLHRLVPDARVVVGHGQMDEDTLEKAMLDFVGRKFDVLLATTIVENGLDIPNANTIIINRADRYGLSQLYQLRGRVGRSDRPAYAYLLIPPEDNLAPIAKKRLAAIREFSDLGSGFRVAALDLEIRGAGNLLGGEQSGHIETVGFELYMKLLEETVRELKGEPVEDDVRAVVNLGVDLRIDERYVADMNQRLMLYRKVAAARRDDEIDRVLDEANDRYGPPPPSLLNLADYGRIRVMADRLGVESIDREGRTAVLKFRAQANVDPVRLVSLVRARPDLTLVPPSSLRVSLAEAAPAQPEARQGAAAPRRGTGRSHAAAPSWWTARAREGAVKPGFTKEEMTRPAKEDPRQPGGVFEQVGGVLSELLDRR